MFTWLLIRVHLIFCFDVGACSEKSNCEKSNRDHIFDFESVLISYLIQQNVEAEVRHHLSEICLHLWLQKHMSINHVLFWLLHSSIVSEVVFMCIGERWIDG